MSLSEDEMIVLSIAAQGAPMMPIGRWKAPVESLVKQGLLRTHGSYGDPAGNFNCVITDEGRAACERQDQEDTDAFKAALNKLRQTPEQKVVEITVKRCPHCGGALE